MLEENGFITRKKKGRTKLVTLTDKFYEYFDINEKEKETFLTTIANQTLEKFSENKEEIDENEDQEDDLEEREQEEQRRKVNKNSKQLPFQLFLALLLTMYNNLNMIGSARELNLLVSFYFSWLE